MASDAGREESEARQPRSVGELFLQAVERFDDRPAMRYRTADDWVDIDWREFERLVRRLGAALCSLGIAKGDRVAILSNSRWEWAVIDQATLAIGAVTVPVYQSNLPHEVKYILEHAGARVVFAEDQEQLSKVQLVRGELPRLDHAVLISGKAKEDEFTLAFDKLMERGKETLEESPTLVDDRLAQVDRDDMATIVYTSGTTGPPKGAVLTHKNLLFEVRALAPVMRVDESDETLLFLPLAHIFARVGAMACLQLGFTISYAESIERLLDNLAEVRPTFMFSVPRIYEKVYNKVLSGVQSGSRLKKQLFAFAMATGRAVSRRRQRGRWVPPYLALTFQAAEMLVFNKLKNTFGGKIRFFISGGAPLSREIAEFFHAAGMLVLEGYGLTECTAASNLNSPTAFRFGTVGKPLPGVDVRIADDGEILIKGDNNFSCYYKRDEATAEAIEDGWFHTGDIGTFDKDGFLQITDRKKDLIVTSGGKNIAPQNIENLLKTDPIISQVMVYGDKRNYLTALVTLDPDEAASYAEHKEIEYETIAELARNPVIQDRVDRAIKKKNQQLASYETIKKFAVLEADFEVGEELTPTLKVKRKFTTEKYIDILEGLYS
jgi:long-chain acyl-CoA synthetase